MKHSHQINVQKITYNRNVTNLSQTVKTTPVSHLHFELEHRMSAELVSTEEIL